MQTLEFPISIGDKAVSLLGKQEKLLIVDDEALDLRLATRLLAKLDLPISTANSTEQALTQLNQSPFSLVLTDLNMGNQGGDTLLSQIRSKWPNLPVVIMSNHGTLDVAVRLMKEGATDFITKPLQANTTLPRIRQAIERAKLEREVVDLRTQLRNAKQLTHPLIGEAPAFRHVLDRLPLAARSNAPVLVGGETGTGKELIARALHEQSERNTGPFVAVNCGALPEALLESELFGHVKGAFTDAKSNKKGLVAEASDGTLFLDEIGDMPVPLQVKLLRFLQDSEIRPVGSNQAQKVNVRIIAATHRNLKEACTKGTFREDLYYRLNVVSLKLPSLHQRFVDLPLLADFILDKHTQDTSRAGLRLSVSATKKLMNYTWPGNIRELENVLHRAIIFSTGATIEPQAIEFDSPSPSSAVLGPDVDLETPLTDAKEALISSFESSYIEAAIAASAGNISQAARRAGRDRKAFADLVRRYNIEVEKYRR